MSNNKTFTYYADKAEHYIDSRFKQRTEVGINRALEIAALYVELAKAAPKDKVLR